MSVIPPSISGSAVPGQTLTCSPGTWAPAPTGYSYSWQRDVTTTIASSGSTYGVTAADVGHAITCTVVASDSLGTSLPAVSVPPVIPTPAPPVGTVPLNVSPPVISGTAAQGQTVSCSSGAWADSPTSYAYSWQRDGTDLAGQTNGEYTLTGADVNNVITCTVVAANSAGSSAPAVSPPIVPLALPVGLVPVATAAPSIAGTAVSGHTVTCSPGSWLNSPTSYSYAWERDALPIAGQTLAQYTLTGADVGQAITCTVVAHNSSGAGLPAISAPIIPTQASGGGGGGGGGSSGGGSGGGGQSGGGSKPPKPHAPTIKAFSVSPRTLVVNVRGKRRSTKGATFRFTLDQKAGVLIEIFKREAGRKKGHGCVATTRRNAKARHCVRWVEIKVLAVTGAKAGTTNLKYAGRVKRGLIASGAYRAYAAAHGSGGWSKTRWTALTVKTKTVRPRPGRQKTNRHQH